MIRDNDRGDGLCSWVRHRRGAEMHPQEMHPQQIRETADDTDKVANFLINGAVMAVC